MMQEVEVLKTIPELVCSYFSEEQFTLSPVKQGLKNTSKTSMIVLFWCNILQYVEYNGQDIDQQKRTG